MLFDITHNRANEIIIKSIKISDKMGNVEIKQRSRKPNSIFGQRPRYSSRSPFKQILSPGSPYYKDFSPIRYSPISHQPRRTARQSLRQQAERSPINSQRQQLFKSREQQLRKNSDRSVRKDLRLQEHENLDISSENKQKCEQIIKKVRNFNDFLVQLKSKIKYDSKKPQQSKERGQISLSVKLENERVELQKYKRLVQRELSKTHSIQNINIQNSNGQKILTIQYEHLKQDEQNVKEEPPDFISDQPLIDHPPPKTKKFSEIQQAETRHNQDKRMQEAKALWKMLNSKTNQLRELLREEQQATQNGEELKDYLAAKERLVKISQLYANIQSANMQSIEVEKRIKSLLT